MSAEPAAGLALALASATLTNLAYLREHDAAAELPVLCMRRPLESARLLPGDRSWLVGFTMESGGFLLYAAALALASLALVQSVAAGGIGVLVFVSARMAGRRLAKHELIGVLLPVFGLVAVSPVSGKAKGGNGEITPILLWLGVTALVPLAAVEGRQGTSAGRVIRVALDCVDACDRDRPHPTGRAPWYRFSRALIERCVAACLACVQECNARRRPPRELPPLRRVCRRCKTACATFSLTETG